MSMTPGAAFAQFTNIEFSANGNNGIQLSYDVSADMINELVSCKFSFEDDTGDVTYYEHAGQSGYIAVPGIVTDDFYEYENSGILNRVEEITNVSTDLVIRDFYNSIIATLPNEINFYEFQSSVNIDDGQWFRAVQIEPIIDLAEFGYTLELIQFEQYSHSGLIATDPRSVRHFSTYSGYHLIQDSEIHNGKIRTGDSLNNFSTGSARTNNALTYDSFHDYIIIESSNVKRIGMVQTVLIDSFSGRAGSTLITGSTVFPEIIFYYSTDNLPVNNVENDNGLLSLQNFTQSKFFGTDRSFDLPSNTDGDPYVPGNQAVSLTSPVPLRPFEHFGDSDVTDDYFTDISLKSDLDVRMNTAFTRTDTESEIADGDIIIDIDGSDESYNQYESFTNAESKTVQIEGDIIGNNFYGNAMRMSFGDFLTIFNDDATLRLDSFDGLFTDISVSGLETLSNNEHFFFLPFDDLKSSVAYECNFSYLSKDVSNTKKPMSVFRQYESGVFQKGTIEYERPDIDLNYDSFFYESDYFFDVRISFDEDGNNNRVIVDFSTTIGGSTEFNRSYPTLPSGNYYYFFCYGFVNDINDHELISFNLPDSEVRDLVYNTNSIIRSFPSEESFKMIFYCSYEVFDTAYDDDTELGGNVIDSGVIHDIEIDLKNPITEFVNLSLRQLGLDDTEFAGLDLIVAFFIMTFSLIMSRSNVIAGALVMVGSLSVGALFGFISIPVEIMSIIIFIIVLIIFQKRSS